MINTDNRSFWDLSVTKQGLKDATKFLGKTVPTIFLASCISDSQNLSNTEKKAAAREAARQFSQGRNPVVVVEDAPSNTTSSTNDQENSTNTSTLNHPDPIEHSNLANNQEDSINISSFNYPEPINRKLELARFNALFKKLDQLDPNHSFKYEHNGEKYIYQEYTDSKGRKWNRTAIFDPSKNKGSQNVAIVFRRTGPKVSDSFKHHWFLNPDQDFSEVPYKELEEGLAAQNPLMNGEISMEEIESSTEVRKQKYLINTKDIRNEIFNYEINSNFSRHIEYLDDGTKIELFKNQGKSRYEPNNPILTLTVISSNDGKHTVVTKLNSNGDSTSTYYDEANYKIHPSIQDMDPEVQKIYKRLEEDTKLKIFDLNKSILEQIQKEKRQQKAYQKTLQKAQEEQEAALKELQETGALEISYWNDIEAQEIQGPDGLVSTLQSSIQHAGDQTIMVTKTITTDTENNLTRIEYNSFKFDPEGNFRDWIIHTENYVSGVEVSQDYANNQKLFDKTKEEQAKIRKEINFPEF